MIPIVELRGAIPFSVLMAQGAPLWGIFLAAIIGNMLPVPIIFLFSRKVLEWGAQCKFRHFNKFCRFCLKKGEKLGDKLQARVSRLSQKVLAWGEKEKTGFLGKLLAKIVDEGIYLILFLFVAIPIPGSGAWTGTLAASILDLNFKKTILAVSVGVVAAGIIMLFSSYGVSELIPR